MLKPHSLWYFVMATLSDKESACNAGDPGSIPRRGRFLGEGNGNPLQYSFFSHSSILDWRIPWTEEPDGLQFTVSQKISHNLAANNSDKDRKQNNTEGYWVLCRIEGKVSYRNQSKPLTTRTENRAHTHTHTISLICVSLHPSNSAFLSQLQNRKMSRMDSVDPM